MNRLEFSVTNSPQYKGEYLIGMTCGEAKLAFTTRWKPRISDLEEVAEAFKSQLEEPKGTSTLMPIIEDIHLNLIHQLIMEGPFDKDIIAEIAEDNSTEIVGARGDPSTALDKLMEAVYHCINTGYISEVVINGEKGSYAVTALGFDMYNSLMDESDVEDMVQ